MNEVVGILLGLGRWMRIECCVCNRAVDEVHAVRDVENQRVVYKVKCHGEEDTCEVDEYFMWEGEGNVVGKTFNRERLTHATMP